MKASIDRTRSAEVSWALSEPVWLFEDKKFPLAERNHRVKTERGIMKIIWKALTGVLILPLMLALVYLLKPSRSTQSYSSHDNTMSDGSVLDKDIHD